MTAGTLRQQPFGQHGYLLSRIGEPQGNPQTGHSAPQYQRPGFVYTIGHCYN
jgi:hypothetical protein